MEKINDQVLKELLMTFGPSGHEEKVRQFIENEIKDYVDEIQVDVLGNLIARKKRTG